MEHICLETFGNRFQILLLFLGEIDVLRHNDLSRFDDDIGGINGVLLFQLGLGSGIRLDIGNVSRIALSAASVLGLGFSFLGLLLRCSAAEHGVGLPQIFRRPPIDGELALDVVNKKGCTKHQSASQQHDGDQEPADLDKSWVDDGQ